MLLTCTKYLHCYTWISVWINNWSYHLATLTHKGDHTTTHLLTSTKRQRASTLSRLYKYRKQLSLTQFGFMEAQQRRLIQLQRWGQGWGNVLSHTGWELSSVASQPPGFRFQLWHSFPRWFLYALVSLIVKKIRITIAPISYLLWKLKEINSVKCLEL